MRSAKRDAFVADLAPAYLPRRPTETVLYGLVCQHLESFLACAREPCPSCAGRRMANTAATVVDRVLPDVPVRQYVLSLPFDLRRLAAFDPEVLTAFGRTFVDTIFASYRARAKRAGLEDMHCGAINFVQRFGGSLNLNVHFHVVVLDGVFALEPEPGVVSHPARPPMRDELGGIVRRVQKRAQAWLRRHGHLDERPLEDRSNEAPEQTALNACASIAMARGQMATLANENEPEHDHSSLPGKTSVAVDRDGFNLHAGVRIEAGDDVGREKLCRYAARPALSLERLRRLPGGGVAYRLKYVGRGGGKHRVMLPMEFMARLAALIPPPRYPLVRYAGVLGPHSVWRKDVVPRPRERPPACDDASRDVGRASGLGISDVPESGPVESSSV
jgi:hypothetical protein